MTALRDQNEQSNLIRISDYRFILSVLFISNQREIEPNEILSQSFSCKLLNIIFFKCSKLYIIIVQDW